jgi:two-component system sensor histidine kinase/response regulator
MPKLADSLVTGDLATAQRMAHSLKGIAATLGADQLAALAAALEGGLREARETGHSGAGFDDQLDAISLALKTLAAALPARAVVPDATDSVIPDAESMKKSLDELDALLDQGNLTVIAYARQHAGSWRAVLGPGYDELARLIEEFAFDSALEALHALRSSPGT